MIDPSIIEDILKHADIVDIVSSYINVIKKGRNYVAICPFHDDKNPSMMLSREKQIFKCFVCGTGGNAITFVQNYEKISYVEAVKKVAELIGFNDERLNQYKEVKKVDSNLEPLYKCINDLCAYYEYGLTTEEGTRAFEYLNERNINENIQQEFHLGYAFSDGKKSIEFLKSKGHSLKSIEAIGIVNKTTTNLYDQNAGRVIFPIHDINGQIVGFSARKLTKNDDLPKYVNSPETSIFKKNNILYNYHLAKNTVKRDGFVYILEGFMDVIALKKAGINSAIALMGTALTQNHIKLIRQLGVEVRMCLDGDNAGQLATFKCCKMLEQEGIPFKVVLSKGDNRDPDEILNEEGKDALIKYLNNLVGKIEFIFNYYSINKPLNTFDEKNQFVNEFIPIMVKTNNRLEIENYILNISKLTGYDANTIRSIYEDARKKIESSSSQVVFKDFSIETKALKRYVLAEREVIFQMISCEDAIKYFERNIEYFYDEIYQKIANYIIELYENNGRVDQNLLISLFDQEDDNQVNVLRNKVIELLMEKHHPPFSIQLMEDCKNALRNEQSKYKSRIELESALKGKDPKEQARLLDEYLKAKN